MIESDYINRYYLYPGSIFASKATYAVDTILGSCVSLCLWDRILKFGSINHFMLPIYDNDGEASCRYGDIAITELIKKMIALGSKKKDLNAKIFGGSETGSGKGGFNIGKQNLALARKMIREHQIPIASFSVGGNLGRKVIFHTDTGEVLIKFIRP